MDTKKDPKELTLAVMERSVCAVQVGAVLVDDQHKAFAWGWNSAGPNGYGLCAERHALRRANRARLEGSTLYVAGRRRKSGSPVTARPCRTCAEAIPEGVKVVYRAPDGWHHYR